MPDRVAWVKRAKILGFYDVRSICREIYTNISMSFEWAIGGGVVSTQQAQFLQY